MRGCVDEEVSRMEAWADCRGPLTGRMVVVRRSGRVFVPVQPDFELRVASVISRVEQKRRRPQRG